MKKYVIDKCPICGKELVVTKLYCKSCDTTVSGDFEFSKLSKLSKENLFFIELFVKNQGNIKLVEKEMGVSYPTVKKYLEDAIESLGYKVQSKETEEILEESIPNQKKEDEFTTLSKTEILDGIKNGTIPVNDAIVLLKKIKGEAK
ncbi:MAG: DUF2089 domain-containing protein [Acholeplasmatales bacterium]|jgi:hypothetical protein|nr:DUF2089 domain-containing protein [Acholeplasmatales bacterium]